MILKQKYAAALLTALTISIPTYSASAEELKIGMMNSLTGASAFGGVPIQNAMKLAIEEANASGKLGHNKLAVIEADTASDKGQTITLISKFAKSDNVLMILGPTTSAEGAAGAPVANDLKVPLFAIGGSPAIIKAGPYALKVQAVGSDIMGSLGDYATKKLGLKKVALVFDRSVEGYIIQKDAFKKSIQDAGGTIASEDAIVGTDTDFLALSTRLAGEDIDGLFVAATAEVAANVLAQSRQGGVAATVKFLGPSALASDAFLQSAGSAADGAIILADYFSGDPSEINQNFVKKYTETYGLGPDNWAAMGYALASLAVQAIKDAGPQPDREKVKNALNALRDQPTVVGNHVWTMDDGRNPHYGAAILVVKDSKFQLAP